jgi:dUTP pyrophosphatase
MIKTDKILVKKLHPQAVIPSYATDFSSGCDLYAVLEKDIILAPSKICIVPTGLAFCIPHGYEIQVRSRSGLAAKNGIFVLNSPGTIDSDYRGEIKVVLANFSDENFCIKHNMRIAQIILANYTKAIFAEIDVLEDTDRGIKGFGSSGS